MQAGGQTIRQAGMHVDAGILHMNIHAHSYENMRSNACRLDAALGKSVQGTSVPLLLGVVLKDFLEEPVRQEKGGRKLPEEFPEPLKGT